MINVQLIIELDLETIKTVDELFIVANQLEVIDAGYQNLKFDTPDYIIDKLTEIKAEIDRRSRAQLQRQLKAKLARRSALRTRKQQREDLDTEIKELQERLN